MKESEELLFLPRMRHIFSLSKEGPRKVGHTSRGPRKVSRQQQSREVQSGWRWTGDTNDSGSGIWNSRVHHVQPPRMEMHKILVAMEALRREHALRRAAQSLVPAPLSPNEKGPMSIASLRGKRKKEEWCFVKGGVVWRGGRRAEEGGGGWRKEEGKRGQFHQAPTPKDVNQSFARYAVERSWLRWQSDDAADFIMTTLYPCHPVSHKEHLHSANPSPQDTHALRAHLARVWLHPHWGGRGCPRPSSATSELTTERNKCDTG